MTFAVMPVAAGSVSCTLTVAEVYNSGGTLFRGFALNANNFYAASGGSVNASLPFLFRNKAVSLIGIQNVFGSRTMNLNFQNYPADGVSPGVIPFLAVYAFGTLFPASAAISAGGSYGGIQDKEHQWDAAAYPVTVPSVGDKTQVILYFS